MSICINKERKQYFISYKSKTYDGNLKTYNITNKDWDLSVGKKYMKSIEKQEIAQDQKRRKLHLQKGKTTTFGDVVDMYVSDAYMHLKKQTAYGKEMAMNKYVYNLFDTKKSIDDQINVMSIEKFKRYIVSLDLSQKRVNDIFRFMRELIEFAADRDFISYNYAKKMINLLKPIKSQQEKQDKLKFWTKEEFDKFLNSFEDNDPYKMLFKVAYMGALRIGELLALEWNDVDFDKHTISINKSVDNQGHVTSTKTVSSNNIVSIPNTLNDELKQYMIDFEASENEPIFFANGRVSKTTVRRKMKKHIEISGVPFINFHGLRHSCASLMINRGCSALIVSKHLRHSSTRETLDTYSHLFPSETVGIIDKIFN